MISGVGLLMSSLLTLTTPLVAFTSSYSFIYMLMVRSIIGLSQGVLYPSTLCLIRNWSSPQDQNRLVALATAGTDSGGIIVFALGGIMCSSSFIGKLKISFG